MQQDLSLPLGPNVSNGRIRQSTVPHHVPGIESAQHISITANGKVVSHYTSHPYDADVTHKPHIHSLSGVALQ